MAQAYRLIALGLLIAGLGLAACGRKGPLEPPAETPDRPFILDKLLK